MSTGCTEGLRKLFVLRKFLKMIGNRWLCGGKQHGDCERCVTDIEINRALHQASR